MFGTEMHWVTFTIIVLQIIILFNQFVHYLCRPKDNSRLRFFFLVLVFLQYNFFSGIFPDPTIKINVLLQTSIAYLAGIILALYFLFYIYREFYIEPFKSFGLKSLARLLLILLLFFLLMPLYLTGDINFSRPIFIIIPLLLTLAFVGRAFIVLFRIYKKSDDAMKHFKFRVLASHVGLLSFLCLPLMVLIGDYQAIEQTLVNIGFFCMTAAYIGNSIYQNRSMHELLMFYEYQQEKNRIITLFNSYNLTNKELEIAILILKGLKYKDIADKMYITEKTVGKHASNIFKKVEVDNKVTFQALHSDQAI